MPKVTIGIAACNVQNYLIQCVSSALEQTFSDIEILIVDDGSTDETGYIADQFANQDPRVRVIHKENEGLAVVRRTIIDNMASDYVYWLDGDDYLKKTAIETVWNIHERSGADIVKTILIPEEKKYVGGYDRRAYMRILLPDYIKSNVIGALFRKALYNGVHHHKGMINDDYGTFPSLMDNANMIVLDDSDTYVYRRVRPGSITYNGRNSYKGHFPRAILRCERYEKYHDEFPEECDIILKQFTDYACMTCLFAEDNDDTIPVRVMMERHERTIMMSQEISAYKKWLLRKIISNNAPMSILRKIHKASGLRRLKKERKMCQLPTT